MTILTQSGLENQMRREKLTERERSVQSTWLKGEYRKKKSTKIDRAENEVCRAKKSAKTHRAEIEVCRVPGCDETREKSPSNVPVRILHIACRLQCSHRYFAHMHADF